MFSVAKSQTIDFTVQWNEPSLSQDGYLLHFDGVTYNSEKDGLPIYTIVVPLSENLEKAEIDLQNLVFGNVSGNERNAAQNLAIGANITPEHGVFIRQKKAFLYVWFTPLVNESGNIQKLLSGVLEYKTIVKTKSAKQHQYSEQSVLSSGNWFKIAIDQTGFYAITYNELKQLGISRPEDIRVYGNGGHLLSVNNADARLDDLLENPIIMEKGSDGVFNEGDYIVFYGVGAKKWKYASDKSMFVHVNHAYSNASYYFLTADLGPGKRIPAQTAITTEPDITTNSYDDCAVYENDVLNLIRSGRVWFGEKFENGTSYSLPFTFPGRITTQPVKIYSHVAARSSNQYSQSYFTLVNIGGAEVHRPTVPTMNLNGHNYSAALDTFTQGSFSDNGENIALTITYNSQYPKAEGYLDYVVLNVRKNLVFTNTQMHFRDASIATNGQVAKFEISGANSNLKVFDVSNFYEISQIPTQLNGSILSFQTLADTLKEFFACDGSSYYKPVFQGTGLGKIENQNLHATEAVDYIIVCPEIFKPQADQLAAFHRENDDLRVLVVLQNQIFNEFSSGKPDAAAIRFFMKMLYDRAIDSTDAPKYLLLYGDGSYDNKGDSFENSNFIITYQSENSLSETGSFVSDDFFSLLDDNESGITGIEDLGVGRFPVRNASEASLMYNKVINYSNPATLGSWHNSLCFLADDANLGETNHMTEADLLCRQITGSMPYYNIDKVYLDAYPQISTSQGEKYPSVTQAVYNAVMKGTLMLNYTGHGNPEKLSHEGVVLAEDVKQWRNTNKLLLFITASCEVSRFDDYKRTSLGEYTLLNPNGGAIACFSTTRLVYSGGNFSLNKNFCTYAFSYDADGKPLRFGDIMRMSKNNTGGPGDINKRNFSLLGDPALRIAIPENRVIVTKINGHEIGVTPDTAKALGKITIAGFVANKDSSKLSSFHGKVNISVFDKVIPRKTLGNDGYSQINYSVQNSLVYRGSATATAGEFELSFIVPRDILYNFGPGKISLYADNGTMDASGFSNKIIVGGYSDTVLNDQEGPEIALYMNDTRFVNGGATSNNPILLAVLTDSSGINTTGNGIGHNITAMLDNDKNQVFILNDYYEAKLDSYQQGEVKYSLSNLAEGEHSLQFKVWDINNISSTSNLQFVVAESGEMALKHILNYPNPFTTSTSFYFEHNQPNEDLDVLIDIFTVSGKRVKTIHQSVAASGFRSDPIPWDGHDEFGDPIGKGVYVYRLRVKSMAGKYAEKFEKLVILK